VRRFANQIRLLCLRQSYAARDFVYFGFKFHALPRRFAG